MSGNPIPPEELERRLKLRVAQVRADMVRHYVRKQRHGLYRFIAPFRKPLMPLAAVLGGIVIAAAVSALVSDTKDCSIEVANNLQYKICTTTAGATAEYIGDGNQTFGSAGTGTFDSFLRVQGTPTERGYNTDGTLEFDTKTGNFTHSMLVSDIPVVTINNVNYWELFADINDGNGGAGATISLNDLEVYFTDDPELTGYDFGGNAEKVYDFSGNILINDVNQGSGRGDLRYRIPLTNITIPTNCDYSNSACETYFVLYTRWGTTSATYNSDGGFEEWKVKQYPTLKIVKDTVGGDDTFSFAVTGTPTPPPVTNPSIPTSGGTGSTQTYIINPGTYTIDENGPPTGWSLTGAVCSFNGDDPVAYTELDPLAIGDDDHVVCTFTNTRDATVTITKDAVPNDPQDFAYTTSGAGLSAFSLDDDADATLSKTKVFTISGANFGAKTVTETLPVTGWTLTNLVCSEGTTNTATGVASFTVDPGDAITCTYTNTKNATVTITKDAVPNDAQDFGYTTSGTGLSGFSLDDDADATLSNTKVFTFAGTNYGAKTVTETLPVAGWSLTNLVCSEGTTNTTTGVASFTVDPGDAITCTYTNTKSATVTITKDAVPNDAQDFAYTTSGAGLSAFSLDDDADATLSNTKVFTIAAADLGAKTVTETLPVTGWALTNLVCSEGTTNTATGVANFTVDAGDAITCTYTNSKLPTIIVQKVTTGSFGGPFNFTTNGGHGLTASFSLTTTATGLAGLDQKSFTIDGGGIGGNFTVTEGITAGFLLTDVTCTVTTAGAAGTVPTSDVGTRTGTITNLTAGTTVTCTFTNSGALTTRTQGFWATHSWLVALVWSPSGTTIGGITTNGMTDAERTLCGSPLTVEQVMGGFWANIAKTSDGTKRSALDQARMRLLQQLLAAILNNQLFGSSPSGTISIDDAKAAFCGTDITAIRNAQAAMAAFNTSGDSGVFTPGQSADAKTARAIADIAFWDVLPK
jgi:hypothetical protein